MSTGHGRTVRTMLHIDGNSYHHVYALEVCPRRECSWASGGLTAFSRCERLEQRSSDRYPPSPCYTRCCEAPRDSIHCFLGFIKRTYQKQRLSGFLGSSTYACRSSLLSGFHACSIQVRRCNTASDPDNALAGQSLRVQVPKYRAFAKIIITIPNFNIEPYILHIWVLWTLREWKQASFLGVDNLWARSEIPAASSVPRPFIIDTPLKDPFPRF